MEKWLDGFLSGYKTAFYTDQVLTVIMLFFLGLIFLMLVKRRADCFMDLLLSYPLGLSVYVISGIILLIFNVEFKLQNLIVSCVILLAVYYLISSTLKNADPADNISENGRTKTYTHPEAYPTQKKGFRLSKKNFCGFMFPGLKTMGIVILSVMIIAGIACIGIFPVMISQDSMYRYSLYPRAIIRYGYLKREYNVFLTDVGLGGAVLGTLPYVFGFNETFGIQTALNLNFLMVFGYAVKNVYCKNTKDKTGLSGINKELIATVLIALLILITSMPFYINSKWAISNMYFMEYLFICVYCAVYYKKELNVLTGTIKAPKEQEALAEKGTEAENVLVFSALFIMLSSLRMEGVVFLILLLLSCLILDYKGSLLANLVMLPCILIYATYYYRIFRTMIIDAPYTFLTEKKAVLQLVSMAVLYLFMILSGYGFLPAIKKRLKAIITAGLLLINLCLFFLDKTLYLADIRACYNNLTRQSGWGVLPVFYVSATALLIFICITEKRKYKFSFMDFLVFSYVLVTVIAGFARGDALQEGIGDSGNRVLLQIVPLAVFAVLEHFIDEVYDRMGRQTR
ncbi:MAG: hypothetical protein K5770_06585 [Lachnospiraceae bacterium]|nr:hypothetical protein [Lachnospiraceae bacterium]